MDEYINHATVIVRLVSFKISIIGEVNDPGVYLVLDDQINLIQALSLAGDIIVYGNRSKINLIRRTSEGTIIKHLDLTDNRILESEYYYLKPNDIVYVEPLKAKRFRTQDVGLIYMLFSTISTIILIINFVNYSTN